MDNLTQKKLRELLKSRGLSPRGTKLELIQRMQHWEQHKTAPPKKEKKKGGGGIGNKRKSMDGNNKQVQPSKRNKKEMNNYTSATDLLTQTGRIKREGVTVIEVVLSNKPSMAILALKDKLVIKLVCKAWYQSSKEYSVLGFGITSSFASAYLSDVQGIGCVLCGWCAKSWCAFVCG